MFAAKRPSFAREIIKCDSGKFSSFLSVASPKCGRNYGTLTPRIMITTNWEKKQRTRREKVRFSALLDKRASIFQKTIFLSHAHLSHCSSLSWKRGRERKRPLFRMRLWLAQRLFSRGKLNKCLCMLFTIIKIQFPRFGNCFSPAAIKMRTEIKFNYPASLNLLLLFSCARPFALFLQFSLSHVAYRLFFLLVTWNCERERERLESGKTFFWESQSGNFLNFLSFFFIFLQIRKRIWDINLSTLCMWDGCAC